MNKEEIQKRLKTIDMLLTMYSMFRDRKATLSKVLDIFLLIGSTLLLLFSVIDPQLLSEFGNPEIHVKLYIGIFSTTIFILSVIGLLVNWKGDAGKYGKACEILVNLKSEWRILLTKFDQYDETSILKFIENSNSITNNLPSIPESKFHKLKQAHKRKVELSKLLDNYPGSSILLIKITLWFKHNKEYLIHIRNNRKII